MPRKPAAGPTQRTAGPTVPAKRAAAPKKAAAPVRAAPAKAVAKRPVAAPPAAKPPSPPVPQAAAAGADVCPRCGTAKFAPEQRTRVEGARTVRYTILVCERSHTFARPVRR